VLRGLRAARAHQPGRAQPLCGWYLWLIAGIAFTGLACSQKPTPRIQPAARSKPGAAAVLAPEPSVGWATQVGQPVLPKRAPTAKDMRIEPATLVDVEYASSELVPVRRLVYRVTLMLPAGMRTHRPAIAAPAGELHVDVGDQRLRARFVGPGWPIDEGSEVRLRADVPGVYLFDGKGGRPLPPGQLASWFQGEDGLRARTDVRLRNDVERAPTEGPGDLLCSFLAEWSQTPRDDLLPRCTGSLPTIFRCGIWSAELTAIVPLNLPRAHLRADAVDPPSLALSSPVRELLDPRDIQRIAPTPVRAPPEEAAQPDAAVSGEGIGVDNRTPARLVIVVQGLPLGWVKPQTSGRFLGLEPGYYRIAALRSSGLLVMPPVLTRVPVDLHFGGVPNPVPNAQNPQLKEPLLNSPDAAR
jgi:hypothetical protein